MHANQSAGKIEVIKICAASFLLRIADAHIAWIFNAWPDITKFLIQRKLAFNGIVYPDLRSQRGISCNLIEFPLIHAMLGQGLYFQGKKPYLIGTPHQIQMASENFRRGFYGFYRVEEMEDCDLSPAEAQALMGEIEGLSLNGIESASDLLHCIPLAPLETAPHIGTATEHQGVRIWKTGINHFAVEYKGHQVLIDCNLAPDEEYEPPLNIDVKNIPYALFQAIDTGEEDGFSTKSCMHTVIRWRDKIICIDLPMNVSYLLNKVSFSHTEIDAVIFTHNHDDHIGELSMLLHLDKKVTIICPRIIWKSILYKAATWFNMTTAELADYFDYHPIRYGEEYDYAGLRILAHPSIHPVPCAVYRLRGIVDQEWKTYSHMSDILNFKRCQSLIQNHCITQQRFDAYRDFLLYPATVKKVDVGTPMGKEEFSVHGSWVDFINDQSKHIVLAHIQRELLDEQATVIVGQVAIAGSARDMSERAINTYQDKYRERARKFLSDYLFTLLNPCIDKGTCSRQQIIDYLSILVDNKIRLIEPSTPFLKLGEQADFIDLVISGVGSVWRPKGKTLVKIASVHAGDIIGDMGVLQQIPRTASIRSETYMYVLRIPGSLFREVALLFGVFQPDAQQPEGILQKIWRHRAIIQECPFMADNVPLYLQNKIAQCAREFIAQPGTGLGAEYHPNSLFIGKTLDDLQFKIGERTIPELANQAIFGEYGFFLGQPSPYQVLVQRPTTLLQLEPDIFRWLYRDVPIFKLRFKELIEQRNIYIQLASHSALGHSISGH